MYTYLGEQNTCNQILTALNLMAMHSVLANIPWLIAKISHLAT